MSRNNLYCQKLKLLPYISAADGMVLCLLLFTQLFLTVEPCDSENAGIKTKFYIK